MSSEQRRGRAKLGSCGLLPRLDFSVLVPHPDQPNHLFLWACSQATKCSWRKLALTQTYEFQVQLDCLCHSAILLLTHDWFPFSFPKAAVPTFYLCFAGLPPMCVCAQQPCAKNLAYTRNFLQGIIENQN